MAHPAPSRSFAVTFSDGEIVYPEFAYPLRDEIIPIWAAALLASLVPILIFLLMQIRIRSFWDLNNAVLGLLYSLISAAVFQVFVKWLIGGLRPHFLDVCKPDVSLANDQGYNKKGYLQLYYTKEICTGDPDQIDDSLEAFPSGHTTEHSQDSSTSTFISTPSSRSSPTITLPCGSSSPSTLLFSALS